MRMHEFELLLCCKSSRKCHHAAQTTPTWTKAFFLYLYVWQWILIAVQPSMAEYEWTMYQMKKKKLCYHALKSYLFPILRNLESNPGFLLFFSFFNSHCIQYCSETSYLRGDSIRIFSRGTRSVSWQAKTTTTTTKHTHKQTTIHIIGSNRFAGGGVGTCPFPPPPPRIRQCILYDMDSGIDKQDRRPQEARQS